ncbi:hypothetical protein CBM2586_A50444 [Cupriavidus phytorum]|uniref:Uncharacterized protein n=1 Tax=Cupriavidus taiwanensis TaxID=164546 RepID=A0A375C3H6_9BURK|nr:hypothetical protein CBM2586_A50444 [Cupriavidus taiwanensis]
MDCDGICIASHFLIDFVRNKSC